MVSWMLTTLAVATGILMALAIGVLTLYAYQVRQKPLTWRFDVMIDYDQPLNSLLREEFEWGAGGWHRDHFPRWEATDFDTAFRHAVFNRRDTFDGKGQKKLRVVVLSFRRPITTKEVRRYFKLHDFRIANAKELLAWGRTIHVPDREELYLGFDSSICPVVALQPVEVSDSFTYGGADRVMALQSPGTPRKDCPQKPWILLKSSDQSFGTTQWSGSVMFVGVEQEFCEAA